jgi:choline-glycine betaine transporter
LLARVRNPQDGTSRYFADPGSTDVDKAQWALTLTVFHWGLHGWIPYCLVGLTLGVASYRHGRPLTMRSCVFPLLGDRVYGWVGDMVDILSIVVVIAGVCTSLGLGTQQIATGLYRLDQTLFDPDDQNELESVWVLIIVVVTLVACFSVLTGLNYGIKTAATTAFMLANFIWLMVFSLDDPVYFLDIAVQTLGHYLQYFVEMGFATDAFQRQKQHGNFGNKHVDAVHKPNYIYPGAPLDTYGINAAGEPADSNGGNAKFMQWWTIFYWGWWIAWSPFVGMFIARISKGRTVREVFNYSMTAPLLYIIMWFAVFGGAGIKMHNTAVECELQNEIGFYKDASAGFADTYAHSICCPVTTKFRTSGAYEILTIEGEADATIDQVATSNMCEWLRPQVFSGWNATTCPTPGEALEPVTEQCMDLATYRDTVYAEFTLLEKAFLGAEPNVDAAHRQSGRRTVYKFAYDGPANFFEVLEQYHGWEQFLSGITIFTIILYFVTSSDSGSYVVDLISAGGNTDKDNNLKDPHWAQRILWSLTEGGLAIGLMTAGGSTATGALQAMSITVGMPFTVVLCFMMPALLRMLAIEDGDITLEEYQWNMPIYGGFLDIFEVLFSFGGLVGGCPSASELTSSAVELAQGLIPVIHASKVLKALDVDGKAKTANMLKLVVIGATWILWIVSLAVEGTDSLGWNGGWFAFASTVYIIMAIMLMNIRTQVRESQGILGSAPEDFLCCFLFYFNTGPQNWAQIQNPKVASTTSPGGPIGNSSAAHAEQSLVPPSGAEKSPPADEAVSAVNLITSV